MVRFILFLHLLGGIGMGFYLILPFLAMRISTLSASVREGYVHSLRAANRIGQILLIVQFLTGGYLISKADVSTPWIVQVIILFVVIGGITGMLGKPMRLIQQQAGGGGEVDNSITNRFVVFSSIAGVLFLALIVLMFYSF
ncbi:hypothetical protein [Paenibacillus contaminans]|uniref:DUF2269 domain-containing protein n=1 Tax=Paenibacillus contaminans TaxID=450362 RepID=A0A329LS81_9BACL|nr:hypothetical protein [Paenibacillus contaminans]RAV10589.1 hypothetical protein DQG23_37555 [Paenibacillus contaminans]